MDRTVSFILKERGLARQEGGCKKAEGLGSEIRLDKRCPVQKRFLPSISEMLGYGRGRLRHEGGTRGDLRKTFGVKAISAQACASRVLLAHHAEGRRGLCQNL